MLLPGHPWGVQELLHQRPLLESAHAPGREVLWLSEEHAVTTAAAAAAYHGGDLLDSSSSVLPAEDVVPDPGGTAGDNSVAAECDGGQVPDLTYSDARGEAAAGLGSAVGNCDAVTVSGSTVVGAAEQVAGVPVTTPDDWGGRVAACATAAGDDDAVCLSGPGVVGPYLSTGKGVQPRSCAQVGQQPLDPRGVTDEWLIPALSRLSALPNSGHMGAGLHPHKVVVQSLTGTTCEGEGSEPCNPCNSGLRGAGLHPHKVVVQSLTGTACDGEEGELCEPCRQRPSLESAGVGGMRAAADTLTSTAEAHAAADDADQGAADGQEADTSYMDAGVVGTAGQSREVCMKGAAIVGANATVRDAVQHAAAVAASNAEGAAAGGVVPPERDTGYTENDAAVGCAAAEWAAMGAAGACATAATVAAHDGDDALPCLMPLGATGGAESTTVAAKVGMGHHSQSKASLGKQQVGPQLGLADEATGAEDTARAAVQLSPAQLRRRAARAAVWVLHFGRLRMEQHGQQRMYPTRWLNVGVCRRVWGVPVARHCQDSAQVG